MQKNILGIIAEYNPFHMGHLYHLQQAKALCNAEKVIVVMSGPFTQRGDAALFTPRARAQMAVENGADMVFELPTVFSVREADYFALGGVSLLTALGCTHIGFGLETNDLTLLKKASALISEPTDALNEEIKSSLALGMSYAKAQGIALEKTFQTDTLSKPNNVLGLCYLSAIRRIGSPLIPVSVTRLGAYHNDSQPDTMALPSATALRNAIEQGNWQGVRSMTDPNSFAIIENEMLHGRIHRPNALDNVLGAMLLDVTMDKLSNLPGTDEGLDRLLYKSIRSFLNRDTMLSTLKSKRYTHTRLNRLLTHYMLGFNKALLPAKPEYARLLGARRNALTHLRTVKESGFTIIEKAADYSQGSSSFAIDMRAYDLWALGARQQLGLGYRQSPIVLD